MVKKAKIALKRNSSIFKGSIVASATSLRGRRAFLPLPPGRRLYKPEADSRIRKTFLPLFIEPLPLLCEGVCQTELVWQIVRITRIQDVTLSGIIIVDNHYFSFLNDRICANFHGICIISYKKIKMAKNPQAKDYRHEDAKRKYIPSAGFAARGGIPKAFQWKLDL
jgi:hypothetical protein